MLSSVGPLLWAPMSELYGRRLLFIGTYIGFTAFNGGVVSDYLVRFTGPILWYERALTLSTSLSFLSC